MTSLLGTIVVAVSALAIMIAAVNTTAASSQKGAERLVTLTKSSRAVSSPASPTAVVTPHRCPTCTDALVQVVDKATKGPNHLVRNLARHNCSTCGTQLVTTGSGKTAATVAMHGCGASEKANCCAMN